MTPQNLKNIYWMDAHRCREEVRNTGLKEPRSGGVGDAGGEGVQRAVPGGGWRVSHVNQVTEHLGYGLCKARGERKPGGIMLDCGDCQEIKPLRKRQGQDHETEASKMKEGPLQGLSSGVPNVCAWERPSQPTEVKLCFQRITK